MEDFYCEEHHAKQQIRLRQGVTERAEGRPATYRAGTAWCHRAKTVHDQRVSPGQVFNNPCKDTCLFL